MNEDIYAPIDCGVHDQLELACMRGAPVRITTDDEILTGVPLTTRTSSDRAEWLVIEVIDGEREIRLDRMRKLESLHAAGGAESIDFPRRQ